MSKSPNDILRYPKWARPLIVAEREAVKRATEMVRAMMAGTKR